MYIFIPSLEQTKPEKGKIISLGIGAKKLSRNIATATPG
jgi:co-chaperonin GroES (HSP10)